MSAAQNLKGKRNAVDHFDAVLPVRPRLGVRCRAADRRDRERVEVPVYLKYVPMRPTHVQSVCNMPFLLPHSPAGTFDTTTWSSNVTSLTDELFPVRRAWSILTVPEACSTHQVSYSLLRQVPQLLTGFVRSLLPCTPRSSSRSSTPTDFSSESLAISRRYVHLRQGNGLARDRRMPFVECPEKILTLPM